MQQYVTSSISSLGLGNRRFSLSRQESTEQPQNVNTTTTSSFTPIPTPHIQSLGGTASGGSSSSSIFSVVAPSVASGSGISNYPAGGVVIGNPNATNPLLGK